MDKNQIRILQALDDAVVKLEIAERAKYEPIAVVGMHGRFPGAADLDAYWQILHDGVDAITEVPSDRWQQDDWYDPNPDAPNKIYTRHGGWLADVDQFDAHFFGISPREATRIDPQQRLLLEVSWHALEQAGIRPSSLNGSQTGMFVGVTTNDYARLLMAADLPLDAYFGSGNALNAVAGRVAYLLGLQGPTMAVDTACSSSLVAIHLACAALRRGECDTALAGGVNVILSPEVTAAICRAKMLSPDGRCKTFDEAADGYVRGEGCGVVVLKRLSDAQATGDNILAVVRGSAVNHDGASSGFTVPNGPAQQALMRQALAQARVKPAEVSYVEAHGTGTALGDPIEVGALAQVYRDRPADAPLLIGSVKTNIGHTEAAAGIAGFIKVVLGLQNQTIPAHLHFHNPSSRIAWGDMALQVSAQATAWPITDKPRLAGLSSFGMSGTNAHLIVGEGECPKEQKEKRLERAENLLVLSGKTAGALRASAAQFVTYLTTEKVDFDDVCYSAATGRDHFSQRLAVVAKSATDAQLRLTRWLADESEIGVFQGIAASNQRRRGQFDPDDSLTHLAEWFVKGGQVDWMQIGLHGQRVQLPPYPFQRQRYWIEESDLKREKSTADSPVLRALESGESADLILQLGASLTTAEQMLLPKLLSMLSRQHQGDGAAVDGLYQMVWHSKRPSGWQPAPDFILNPNQLYHQLSDYMHEVNQSEDVKTYTAFLDELDVMAVGYILQAFAEMGWQWVLGQRFTTADIVEGYGIRPNFGRMVQRLLTILAEEGILNQTGTGGNNSWVVKNIPAPYRILSDVEAEQTVETELLARCGNHLMAVLRGEQDPLQLLFPDSDATSAANLYEDVLGATVLNGLLAQAVSAAVAQLPVGRPLRVLEIGAGTGGSTSSILPLLPATQTEYTFTDITTAFTRQASEKFDDYDFIEYRRLDIEQSPLAQGYLADYYDLVIAANVLHATRNLPKTLTHVRQLLAPNGLLVLLEGTMQMRWIDLIFGLTEGWWRFEDQVRQGHPLLTTDGWQKALGESGFARTSALAQPEGILSKQGVMLAQTGEIGPESVDPEPSGDHWLILADRSNMGQMLAEALRLLDHTATLVDEESYQPDWLPLLDKAVGTGITFRGIVNLWPLNGMVADENEIMNGARRLCEPLIGLVKALAQRPGWRPKLTIVTQDAITPNNRASLAQSMLWGLRRTLTLEHPEWEATSIDIGDIGKVNIEAATSFVLTELFNKDGEDQVVWGANGRSVPRLLPLVSHLSQPGELSISPDGSYLITGGLGGLGLLVAEWLVAQGGRHLVLIGRNRPSATAEQMIGRLTKQGATVQVCLADVADKAQLATVITGLDVPLRGVIHAAGALDDGILLQQNWGRFERVMQAKVAGSWHLHTLTADYKLDFFVLFSSTVGLFGNAGQGNHAAANAFLDSLAYYRQGLGLPALCIDWGAWGEVGAAARRQVLTTGATLITPSHGLRMLEAAMLQAGAQLAAVPLVRHELPNRPLFAELQPLEADAPASVTTGDSFMTQLLALPVGKRHTWLKEEVQTQLTAVLGVFGSDWWGTDAGFFDMGMDSLTAVEFRNALQNRVQIPLPTTVAFDYPTIATLADYLLEAIEIVEKGDSEIKTVQVEKAQKATNQEASEANRDAVMLDLLDEDALALLLDEELEGFEE